MIFDCASRPFRGRILPMNRNVIVTYPAVGGCLHNRRHDTRFHFQSRRKALWCFQDVFRLNSLIRSP